MYAFWIGDPVLGTSRYTYTEGTCTYDSARSSLFTLFPRFFTVTPGSKMTTIYVTADQSVASRPERYQPISEQWLV